MATGVSVGSLEGVSKGTFTATVSYCAALNHVTDAGAVFATIFDHKPFLESEQKFFIKEFEVAAFYALFL